MVGRHWHRKLTLDMRDLGERCGKHRVARLLKLEGLRSQTGYRRRPGMRGGTPAVVAPNHLRRQVTVAEPNQSWVPKRSHRSSNISDAVASRPSFMGVSVRSNCRLPWS